MKVFVDENIPLMTVAALRTMGHDVHDIRGTPNEGLRDNALREAESRQTSAPGTRALGQIRCTILHDVAQRDDRCRAAACLSCSLPAPSLDVCLTLFNAAHLINPPATLFSPGLALPLLLGMARSVTAGGAS